MSDVYLERERDWRQRMYAPASKGGERLKEGKSTEEVKLLTEHGPRDHSKEQTDSDAAGECVRGGGDGTN